MLDSVLRLAGYACLVATALPAAAVDIEIVNQTTLAVPQSTNGYSRTAGGIGTDGRYALFFSDASNIVAGDTNRASDLFLHDRQDGSAERVSLGNGNVQANGETLLMADLSADARYIAFESRATNLVGANTHGTWQIFLRDRVAQTTTLVSAGPDGSGAQTGGYRPRISADGRYVVFVTYDALVENDFNGANDVYRYDRTTGTLALISVSITGESGDLDSNDADISADGRYVAFRTLASNLVPGDANFAYDIVLRDTVANVNVNASVTPSGSQFAGQHALASANSVSDDGRYVLYSAIRASAPFGVFILDGFRYDRVTNQSTRVTLGPGATELPSGATARALSADGSVVLMETTDGLVAGTTSGHVRRHYARNLGSGAISLVKRRAGAVDATDESLDCGLSGDATTAYCNSYGRGLSDTDDNALIGVFRATVGADSGELVSRPLPQPVAAANADSGGFAAGASDDGRFVAFESLASNLVVGDTNGVSDVFLRDRLAGTTQRISVAGAGAASTCASAAPRMTPDGRYVVFESCGALVTPATGTTFQIYRYDRLGAQLELVSTGPGGVPCNADCRDASVSADGSVVAFTGTASNMGTPAPATRSVYVRSLPGGTIALANRPAAGSSGSGNGFPNGAQVSGNGRWVYFTDSSTNLVNGDTNDVDDVFAFDRTNGTLQRASLGTANQELATDSRFAGVSHDGSRVLFHNAGLVCATSNGLQVRDTVSGQIDCVSTDGVSFVAYAPANTAAISADGNRVAFTTLLPVPPYVTEAVETVMLHDRTTRRIHRLPPLDINRAARILHMCAAGDCLLFGSTANNLVADDPNNHIGDVFIAQRLVDDTIFGNGFEQP